MYSLPIYLSLCDKAYSELSAGHHLLKKYIYIYIFIFSNFGSRDILKCQCLVGLFLSVITSVARQGPELLLCVQCTGARTCNTLLMVASLTLGRFCL